MKNHSEQNTGPGISRNKLLGVAGIGWLFDAMDVGILSFIIAALTVDWNLSSNEMGWIGSINSIGMAVGAFLLGCWQTKSGEKQFLLRLYYVSPSPVGFLPLQQHWLCF